MILHFKPDELKEGIFVCIDNDDILTQYIPNDDFLNDKIKNTADFNTVRTILDKYVFEVINEETI